MELVEPQVTQDKMAVGLFNRGPLPSPITASWKALGLSKPQVVRDVWRQQDLGTFEDQFEANVPSHGVVLLKLTPKK